LCLGALLTIPLSVRHAAAGETAAAEKLEVAAAHRDTFAACEQRLEQARRPVPAAAILGASYTAGAGPDNPAKAWAVVLARMLRWDAVVYGVPGAGYVRAGSGHRGPVLRMIARVGLRRLDPALVILQFGHDDIGVRAETERLRVTQAIRVIRAEDPRARIALVTAFVGRRAGRGTLAGRRARAADRVIVTAARAADRNVIIMDPLTGHWPYPRARDGLHPTAAGDEWIARKAAAILRASAINGMQGRAVAGSRHVTIICAWGIAERRAV
jgi:lysophospholipase L1-like esterase